MLAYSSFLSPEGLGSFVKKIFEAKYKCHLELVNGGSSSELLVRASMQPLRYDAVLGIQYENNLTEFLPWQGKRVLFAHSPMIILKKGKGAKEVIVPDLRKSEVGKNFETQKFDEIPLRRVSSWTQGLSVFNQKKNALFYTFIGSFFYYKKKLNNENIQYSIYKELPKKYNEYIKFLKENENHKNFLDVLLSKKTQEQIWEKNYMYPVLEKHYPESLKAFLRESL